MSRGKHLLIDHQNILYAGYLGGGTVCVTPGRETAEADVPRTTSFRYLPDHDSLQDYRLALMNMSSLQPLRHSAEPRPTDLVYFSPGEAGSFNIRRTLQEIPFAGEATLKWTGGFDVILQSEGRVSAESSLPGLFLKREWE